MSWSGWLLTWVGLSMLAGPLAARWLARAHPDPRREEWLSEADPRRSPKRI